MGVPESEEIPVVRELGVLIRKTLLTRRGQVLRVESMKTKCEHIVPNMLVNRIADLPLDQTEPGTTFELDARNDSPHTRIVWSGEFHRKGERGGVLPFPRKSPVINLSPGQSLRMTVSVRSAEEQVKPSENPGGKLASRVSVVPVDQGTEDSLVSEPRHYVLAFRMDGYITPTWELRRTLASASSRLRQEYHGELAVSAEEGGGFRVDLSPDVPPGSGIFLSRLIFAKDPSKFVTFQDIDDREVVRIESRTAAGASDSVREALREAVAILDGLLSQLPDGAK